MDWYLFRRSFVSRSTIPSLREAKAQTILTVEHGWKPLLSASFWFTIVRMRPLLGSATTTVPLYAPKASTAARRTTRSSPSTLSPMVESANVGDVQGLYAIRTGLLDLAGTNWAVAGPDEGLITADLTGAGGFVCALFTAVFCCFF